MTTTQRPATLPPEKPRRRGVGRPIWLRAPRSLRVQMALGSALVALAAVVIVALTAVITVAITFNHYQSAQISNEANQIAVALGAGQAPGTSATPPFGGSPAGFTPFPRVRRLGAASIWVMDTSGQLIMRPVAAGPEQTTYAADEAVVTPALRDALRGHTSEGTLSDSAFPPLVDRFYTAVPVHQGGKESGPITGAIALSTPPRSEPAGVFSFLSDVNSTVLFSSITAALLAAIGAIAFSRRLTRPLAHLSDATARMAAGDYATRVAVSSPTEISHLATSFNDMAAALERDIGELRWQEQLRRELVANVSHELATPLTAIEGFSEALLDGVVHDPTGREQTVRTIAREAARLHRLVDQLRQVALYEAGAQALERDALDLPALVTETLAVLAPEMEQKHVTLASDLPADLPLVYADGDRITEVLLNLLDNALHHTPSGGRVEIAAARDGSVVRVTVGDTGAGIDPAQRERIFERFFRADPSRNAATGGSGLGLAIVRALVEAHGGTISAGERPGGGARFSFTLPVYAQQARAVDHLSSVYD